MSSDIVETAVESGSFQTLPAAVTAAGLAETLQGKGPFTVFAPTDDAFAKLPAGTVEGLLADKAKLTSLLTYHVVPGRVSGTVTIDAANVVRADVLASDGMIHAIDTVLSPQ